MFHTCYVLLDSGEQNAPIGAMPGCERLGWRHGLIDEVGFSFCLWMLRVFSHLAITALATFIRAFVLNGATCGFGSRFRVLMVIVDARCTRPEMSV